jgi:hypothetical protein
MSCLGTPVIEHGFQIEPIKPLPSSTTYTSCPDCARLKALLGDLWIAYRESYDYKRKKLIPEFEARLKQEGIIFRG